jgi:cytochrome c
MRRLVFGTAAIFALATPLVAPATAQDVDNGKAIFGKCRACHQVGENAKNMVGPELNGLFGRKAGSVEGFNYSEANKHSGITWDEPTFREYIKNPKAKIPGTKMVFVGIPDDQDIDDLIAYLKQFAPDGKIKK